MTPPRIPSHEADDIVEMTPPYSPDGEADDIVEMTPPEPLDGAPEDVTPEDAMDLTPQDTTDGTAARVLDISSPHLSNGKTAARPAMNPAMNPAMAPGQAPHGAPQDFQDFGDEYADEYADDLTNDGMDRPPAHSVKGDPGERAATTYPPMPRPKPEEWQAGRPKAGGSRWKLILVALAGLVVVVVAMKALGPLSGIAGIGGSQGSQPQSTSAPTTSTPAPNVTQPVTSSSGPLILLNPGVVRQGAAVAVLGSGFDPGATVDLTLKRQASGTTLASSHVLADQGGFFGDAAITVPISLGSGNFIVEAHERNSTKTVRATGTIAGGAPQVKLGVMVGKPGDLITVSLHGFAPEEPINVYWNTMSGDPVTQLKADGGGGVGQAKLRVPFGALGDNTFLFVGANSQSLVAANFLMLKMYPTIKLSSYALKADNVMSFSGSGFGPNERVLVFLNSPNSAPVTVVPTDEAGAFKNATGFVVPFALKGKQTLIFMGEQSRSPNEVAFTIMPYAPIVEPSTYGGFPGTTITFFGTGFARNEVVHIYTGNAKGAHGAMVGCFQADDRGNAAAVGSYLIPGDAQGAVGFTLVGAKSGGVGVASLNVSAPPAPVHTPPQPPFTCPLDSQPTPAPAP